MKHVLVQALTDDLPKISLALAEVGVFDPDVRSVGKDHFPTVPGDHYRELFKQAQSRMDKISRLLPMPEKPQLSSVRVVDETELERLNAWLGDIWATASSYEERFRRLSESERVINLREDTLENFANLRVDLGLLHSDSRFLSLFVGTVPSANAQQLEEALGLAGHMMYAFREGTGTTSVIIVGQRNEQQLDELNSVLQAASFQPLVIPQDLRSQPQKIREEIQSQRTKLTEERQQAQSQLENWAASLQRELVDAQRTLILAEPFVLMDTSMRSAGSLGTVTGWVPARSVKKLEANITQKVSNPFLFTVRDPTREEVSFVPSLMQPNAALAPYQDVIKQYGVPRYGEVDPSWLFAVTFVFMFGAMFGDVGQGGVITALALLFRKSLGHFVKLAVPMGMSSIFFGFMYGSVFGYEDVLIHHIWVSPLHHPEYMLVVGVFWGVSFITMASALSVYNHFIANEPMEAVLGHHGIMSIVLYLSVMWGLVQVAMGGGFGWIPTIFTVLSISAISAHAWHEMHDSPIIERVMVVAIGAMEIFMGYISNTLSFLRVAAFSVNHSALALAVFAIANSLDTTGHWISIVLGNIFIMVLEGSIVGIQTLRLEYYEGFSRYYSGDGREYEPITLNIKASDDATMESAATLKA
ncbi:hypothetical protein TI04_06200 [Achromatium sp. WMS2]|nr:hypothetical protein TI04_06200 [Achromatium sp. WMS2]